MSNDSNKQLKARASDLKVKSANDNSKISISHTSLSTLHSPSKKGFGGPFKVVLSAIAIFLVSQLAAFLVVDSAYQLLRWLFNDASRFSDSTCLQALFIVMAEAVAVWLVWLLLKRRRLNWAAIGLGRRPARSDIKWAALGFGLFYCLVIAVSLAMTLFTNFNLDQHQEVGFNHLNNLLDNFLAFFSLVLLPPIGEEILVRGYLYSGLRSRLAFAPALLITSLLFGAAHLQTDNGQLVWAIAIDTFLLSLVLVYLREKTGALYSSMGLHALNNLVAFIVVFH